MSQKPRPPSRIQVYATPHCGDTRLARYVLDRAGAAYDLIDIRADETAARFVEEVNNGYRSSPTIVFPDGTILVEPRSRTLRAKLQELQAAGYDLSDQADD